MILEISSTENNTTDDSVTKQMNKFSIKKEKEEGGDKTEEEGGNKDEESGKDSD